MLTSIAVSTRKKSNSTLSDKRMKEQALALRLDDPGASSKRYEVYSDHRWNIKGIHISANWLFLKYMQPFKKWGPYREMRGSEWFEVFDILQRHDARLTVAVTATWVVDKNRLIPFNQRFPEEAAALKEGMQQGLIEIANHGLTHCVLQDNLFKPKLFEGNRQYHREFWDWLPLELHEEHIQRSQEILQSFFETDVVTFVPPGNVYNEATLEIAMRYGLRYLSCQTTPGSSNSLLVLGNENTIPFHDRELVLYGVDWLDKLLTNHSETDFGFVRELGSQKVPGN